MSKPWILTLLAPGHGPLGTKDDVRAYRGYMEELYTAVRDASRAGKSVDEMKQTIRLDKYKTWARYERIPAAQYRGHVPPGQHAPPWQLTASAARCHASASTRLLHARRRVLTRPATLAGRLSAYARGVPPTIQPFSLCHPPLTGPR